jgi:hypothetical protein
VGNVLTALSDLQRPINQEMGLIASFSTPTLASNSETNHVFNKLINQLIKISSLFLFSNVHIHTRKHVMESLTPKEITFWDTHIALLL